MPLSPNSLAFIALSNEFCAALENVSQNADERAFIADMTRLLPRLYITASDLRPDPSLTEETPYIDSYLDEDYYESVRSSIENLLGPDDVYLEVFEEDMKYSDTPIRASISEGLCDIFQVLYNFISTVRDAPADIVNDALLAVRDDFASYWSQRLVNLMRPINQVHFSVDNIDEDGTATDSLASDDASDYDY